MLQNLFAHMHTTSLTDSMAADKREFIKISQAVGVGFVVMGAIGYIVKLGERGAYRSHGPQY